MGAKFSGLSGALYDSKKKQFLGRDGAGWGKLGVFYFFFYLGLAGFFCAMLAVFMALSPRDRPRYILQASRMRTRSNPLSPGLGFRPQPESDKNLIYVQKYAPNNEENAYVKNLNQYLGVYYWKDDPIAKKESDEDSEEQQLAKAVSEVENKSPKFQINNVGNCHNATNYGYTIGQPCVLVKMNKLVGFVPKPGAQPNERDFYRRQCGHPEKSVSIHCYGESPADVDNIGPLTYYSENVQSGKCGSLSVNRFPYNGKYNRQDKYQAPYVWVQFTNPKPNVLINVVCRAYGQNIHFDRKSGRGLTRFQIFVDNLPVKTVPQKDDI